MLSDAAQKDLHRLADQRVEAALNSVVQLLENDEQVQHLILSVLTNTATAAATHMREHSRKPDGSKPSMAECTCRVVTIIASVLGFESKVIRKKEAKRVGFWS